MFRINIISRLWCGGGGGLVAKSCPTFCNPIDCSPPGSSLCVEFPRQKYWSGLPFPSPGALPNPGVEPTSLIWQVDSLPLNYLLCIKLFVWSWIKISVPAVLYPLLNLYCFWIYISLFSFAIFCFEKKKSVKSLSCVWLFVTPWTVACQATLAMGFSRQEYWSTGSHSLLQEIFLTEVETWSPALQAHFLPPETR